MKINEIITDRLWMLQDSSYRDFQAKLIPSIPAEQIIGVRMPALQKMAKELMIRDDLCDFLRSVPHAYYDENNLHAFMIAGISDYDRCIFELDCFLPYVDNWATCDSLRPKCFKENLDKLLPEIMRWVNAFEPFTVRFGLEMLMVWYLGEHFRQEFLEIAAGVKGEEYYVKMMQAWFFATALTKQYAITIPYIHERRLPVWVHNKAIQKALESRCISQEQKKHLRTLKIQKDV